MRPDHPIISIEYVARAELTVAQVWPDGDAPDNPTASDVADVIAKNGGINMVLDDWRLSYEATVAVTAPNPHWRPDPPLFPDLAPEPVIVTEVDL